MSAILTDLSRSALSLAVEESEIAYWEYRARASHWELCAEPGMTWYRSDLPSTYFNGVLRTTLTEDEADERIATTLAAFKRRGLPGTWWLGPSRMPADLGARLKRFGLTGQGDDPGMAVDLRALRDDVAVPAGLLVERVCDDRGVREWLRAWRLGNELDAADVATLSLDRLAPASYDAGESFRFYVARLGGEPVAVSQLLLAAGVAGIYNVATVPEARRKGIGAAVTLAPLREARAEGYRAGVLGASALGFPMYRRLGFQRVCMLSMYTWTGGVMGEYAATDTG